MTNEQTINECLYCHSTNIIVMGGDFLIAKCGDCTGSLTKAGWHTDTYEYQVLTYGKTFPSLEGARACIENMYGPVDHWDSKDFPECEWHGSSEVAVMPNGNEVAEIIFLMNGKHCNPDEGKTCGYQAEVYHFHMCKDGEKLPCLSRLCAPKSGNEVWYDQAQAKANEELFGV